MTMMTNIDSLVREEEELLSSSALTYNSLESGTRTVDEIDVRNAKRPTGCVHLACTINRGG